MDKFTKSKLRNKKYDKNKKRKIQRHKTLKRKTHSSKTNRYKTQRSKTNRYKTQRRKTQRRKTQRRKTQRRKTQRRKTQRSKTQKSKNKIIRGGEFILSILGTGLFIYRNFYPFLGKLLSCMIYYYLDNHRDILGSTYFDISDTFYAFSGLSKNLMVIIHKLIINSKLSDILMETIKAITNYLLVSIIICINNLRENSLINEYISEPDKVKISKSITRKVKISDSILQKFKIPSASFYDCFWRHLQFQKIYQKSPML